MPIYAYKCESCGFVKDVLQKMSDPVLEVCPSCGQPAFKKQLTAAGFQLKGSGWYATDFKGSGSAPAVTPKTDSSDSATGSSAASKTDSPSATPAAASTASSTPVAAPATSAPPSAASGA